MAIKNTLGMTLKEFIEEKKASQITVQHGINERITHIKGFDRHKDYKLIEGHTIWYKVGDSLIKEVYKKKSTFVKNVTKILNKRK